MQFLHSVGRAVAYSLGVVARSIAYVVAGTVLVAALVATATAAHVWAYARADERPASDVIFVLGAAQYDGVPSSWLAARLDQAAELYGEGVAPTIVTVGGSKPGDRYTEAESGKNYLMEQHGVPESAIVAIEEGVDTLTSAEALARESQSTGWHSVVVVSDPGHSLRATTMVRDQGFEATGSPTRQGPSVRSRAAQLSSILHETGGLMYYETVERERDNLHMPFQEEN